MKIILNKIVLFLDRKQKLRKELGHVNLSLSLPARIFAACVPLLAFSIVIYQVYSSSDTDTILSSSGVKVVDHWQWEARLVPFLGDLDEVCGTVRCWQQIPPLRRGSNLKLPAEDPIGNGVWEVDAPGVVVFHRDVAPDELSQINQPVLYIPGIRAKEVVIWVDGERVVRSYGGLPFFVPLKKADGGGVLSIQIGLRVEPTQSFQGFIRKEFFMGNVLSTYRAHYRLTFKSFPRHAVVLFLLAIGALTFTFFIFLDQKFELFALGLAISLLGAAEAVKVGIVPFLSTKTYFFLFSAHIAFTLWYGTELARLSSKTPWKIILGWLAVILAYFASWALPLDSGSTVRFGLLQILNAVPLLMGVIGFGIAVALLTIRKERASQLALSCLGFIIYSAYLASEDFEALAFLKISSLNETPVLFCVSTWIISGLASLGSLERRVQLAVEDREKRLKLEQEMALAEEVQKSFINAGLQSATSYEVRTIYKAVKSVGGDWVAWRELEGGYGLAIIGDVVGKGVQAGLIVSACDAALQGLLAELDPTKESPEVSMRQIVVGLYNSVITRHERRNMTAMIILASAEGRIHVASLGHPPLLGISSKGTRVITAPNSWLSRTFDFDRLAVKTFDLEDNEIILGYTDGVCDGSKQLRQFRKQWEGWFDKGLEELEREFLKLNTDYDDQAVLLLRRKADATAVWAS